MITHITDRERAKDALIRTLESARDEMAKRIEALTADAARYRWLRHGDNDEHVLEFSSFARCGTDDVWVLRMEALDAAIDAAMKDQPIWDQLAEIGTSDPQAWDKQ